MSVQCFCAFSNDSIEKRSNVPIQDHFVFLNVHLLLSKKSPVDCIKDKNCVLVSSITENVNEINDMFMDTPMLVGSGFVFKHKENKTHIISKIN